VETDVPAVKLSGKATRLRLVNTGASAGYSVQLDRAKFQLISVDGGGFTSDSTPQTSTIGVLYPGERMDVLLLPEMATRQSGQPDAAAIKIVLDLE
jgi:FtsP/CotA-like multicopper oxidase with cupredoxin domain